MKTINVTSQAQVTKQVGSDIYKQRQQRARESAQPASTQLSSPIPTQSTTTIVDTSTENSALINDLTAPQVQATGASDDVPIHKKVKRGLKIIVLVLLIVCLCIIIYILGCVIAHTCTHDVINHNHYDHDSSDENSSQYNNDRVFP